MRMFFSIPFWMLTFLERTQTDSRYHILLSTALALHSPFYSCLLYANILTLSYPFFRPCLLLHSAPLSILLSLISTTLTSILISFFILRTIRVSIL
ncbi:hypothetical protein BKA70DRAFT_405787 [Coprinopsis sp. MPI-PUGE-AT-0042]|nr:hypothetical protein BKA70DRAFT_405787 [Coprinopsis sp. MPI-PUGE-AT-0042]